MAQTPDDFRDLFEFLPIGAFRTSVDGVMLRANPALVRMNGFGSEAEHLAAVTDIAGHWYVQPGRRTEQQALLERQGRVVAMESEVWRYKTRERIWVSENVRTVRDDTGQVLLYEGTVEEITERVQARAVLERSEQELRAVTAQVPGVVYRVLFEPDGTRRIGFISDGVRTLYGVEPEQALTDNRLLSRFQHPDDRARVSAAIDQVLQARLPLALDFRIVLPDGRVKWIQQTSVAAPDEGRTLVRIGMLMDISDRKRAEDELRLSGERWKLALEATGDGVWDWLVQDGVEILSPQCKAMYGFDPDELPDQPDALNSRTHPDDLPAMRAAQADHFAGRTPSYVNEHRVLCKDGRWKWTLSRGVVLSRDARGQPLRMIGTHTDITERKQAEALRLERDLAAAADQAKTLFLSRVSHELRTPLNAILGFAQLLEMQAQSPSPAPHAPHAHAAPTAPSPAGGMAARELAWVQQILNSGRHLLALMDDILDLSSAQTGKLPMHAVVLDLRPVVEEAWTMLAADAQAVEVEFIDAVPADAALAVLADRKRVKQILSNLLSNAIKYNGPGGWVRVSAQAAPDDPMQVLLSVADSGPGLSAAQLQRLFQPFERLGAQRGPVTGSGLGLALSRQLAEAMDGRLTADSAPGGGARFVLRLPRA